MKAKKDSKFGMNYELPIANEDINMNQNATYTASQDFKDYYMDNSNTHVMADNPYGGERSLYKH